MTDLPGPPRAPHRLAYLGTPDLAVAPLRALVAAGHEVVLVVSGADRRRGRGAATAPSPVKAAALEMGLPVSEDPADAARVGADLGVVVAYGRLIRRPVLEAVPMVNLHFSLLPRWRGAAPVERAILAGDERTGVCLMAVEEGLDTGGIYAQATTDVDRKTLAELRTELVEAGIELLLAAVSDGFGPARPQEGEVTYAAKVEPEERHLDLTQPAAQLDRVVRIGGAWTTFRGARLKVHEAVPVAGTAGAAEPSAVEPGMVEVDREGVRVVAGDGRRLELVAVQPEGKGRMAASAWRNGIQPRPGDRLGT